VLGDELQAALVAQHLRFLGHAISRVLASGGG